MYLLPQTRSVTEMASKPADSAASTISTTFDPRHGAPPSHDVDAMCNPSFTANYLIRFSVRTAVEETR